MVEASKSFLQRVSYFNGFHILRAGCMRFTTSLAFPSFFLCCPSQRQGTRHPRWLTTTGAAQTRLWAAESDTRPVSDAALGKCTRNAQKKSKTVSLTNTRGKQRKSTRCNVSNGQKELWALGLCLIYSFPVFVCKKKKTFLNILHLGTIFALSDAPYSSIGR